MILEKIISLSLISSSITANFHTIPDSAIAQYSWQGTLGQCEDGFVYLDLDDAFVHDLVKYIEPDGFVEPPYFDKTGLIGAHISVFYAKEAPQGLIEELGQTYSFTPTHCMAVQPLHWDGIEEVYIIEVESPELDALRAKYGLQPWEFGFHITIGVKPS
ncbi:MAG: hypothetical protein K1X28_03225 [Parachlamydiales bacterium]|nr:hypothetical protein [Parachlamydiales bacterium]